MLDNDKLVQRLPAHLKILCYSSCFVRESSSHSCTFWSIRELTNLIGCRTSNNTEHWRGHSNRRVYAKKLGFLSFLCLDGNHSMGKSMLRRSGSVLRALEVDTVEIAKKLCPKHMYTIKFLFAG